MLHCDSKYYGQMWWLKGEKKEFKIHPYFGSVPCFKTVQFNQNAFEQKRKYQQFGK